MYKELSGFEQPHPDSKLWRYMDFTKFISLLDLQSLFFVRGDKLDDPFEGSFPKVNSPVRPHLFGKDVPEQMLKEASQAIIDIFKKARPSILVNCWHENEYESAAMWKLYARDNDGIAVRTNFRHFTESFIGEEEIYVGKVKYIDFGSPSPPDDEDNLPLGNVHHPFMYKRPHFEYEHEVRATVTSTLQLVLGDDAPPYYVGSGIYEKVDLDKLVEEIVISPYAEEWFHELVQSVAERYGLKAPIRSSSLSDKPTWGYNP